MFFNMQQPRLTPAVMFIADINAIVVDGGIWSFDCIAVYSVKLNRE